MTRLVSDVRITNLKDGETVHQRCLLLIGECPTTTTEDHISVRTKSASGREDFPDQNWPVSGGNFKALAMLSPGQNTLYVNYIVPISTAMPVMITVNYIPLLQNPPLHLAVMVAKDSPCVIDCPPHKAGGVSSAHADLDAAIAKLRMTAYMWQAMTAEDMRLKSLGRRTFRLEEEWAPDTVSRDFLNARFDEQLDCEGAMRSTARVHIIRSSRTVKEIRARDIAQQNPSARKKEALFDYFKEALQKAGGPFISHARPIVAGLILDSHYSASQDMILGHAALGGHNPKGVSLGMFGSHLTYAWPRFLEEVTACLTDFRPPGYTVGNDNGQCGTMWEACTIGQGAHLHEVGHAFGLPHRPGIMERGYARDWPKHFLSKTAFCSELKEPGVTVLKDTHNNARWDLADGLAFAMLPHFRHPHDEIMVDEDRNAEPKMNVDFDSNNEDEPIIHISSRCGLARVMLNGTNEPEPTVERPVYRNRYTETELLERFDRMQPLRLQLLASNGKESTCNDVWKILANRTFIRVPCSSIRLNKISVGGYDLENHSDFHGYHWAQLLSEKGADGILHRAVSIDLRVGCLWDGGIVQYADGHVSHWGPMRRHGQAHYFGGHASEEINLQDGVEITSIEVNKQLGNSYLSGVRMHLADGTVRGELNTDSSSADVHVLEPPPGEVIVGFFGRSEKEGFCGIQEFGIITVVKEIGLKGLPESVFNMSELKNSEGLDEPADVHNSIDDYREDNDGNVSEGTMEWCE